MIFEKRGVNIIHGGALGNDYNMRWQVFLSLFGSIYSSQSLQMQGKVNNLHQYPIVLGSGSSTRRKILEDAGFRFIVHKASIDERSIGNRSDASKAEELVLLLGHAKADAVVDSIMKQREIELNDLIVLTGDQVVTCNGRIFEKPLNEAEARKYVSDYGNYPCQTVGSIVLTELKTKRRVAGVDTATIHFKPIPDDLVDELISEGDIMQCAGGLMIEHPKIQGYIDKVDGSIDSVMGLSLSLLKRLLESLESNY